MPRVTVSLPDHLKAFVDAEVAERRLDSAADYISQLVMLAYLQKHRAQVEQLLLEAINNGPSTPMTAQEWKGIEREGLEILAREQGDATKIIER